MLGSEVDVQKAVAEIDAIQAGREVSVGAGAAGDRVILDLDFEDE